MSALRRSTVVSAPARRRGRTAPLGHEGRMRLDEVLRRLREPDPSGGRTGERSGSAG